MYYLFSIGSLRKLRFLPGFDSSKVTSMHGIFNGQFIEYLDLNYLNTDNVIAEHPCGQLYTYKSGKVKCLGGFSLWEPSKSKYYKKKNLIADYAYSDASDHDIQYLGMSGNKIKLKLIKSYYTKETMEGFDMKKSIEYYDWTNGNEEISKKQFNKRLKKLKGNKRSSKFKWHKNTKKNRKKYLK